MQQIQQELELRNRADVLVTDRAVVDNYAYFLRVTGGDDPFDVEPLIARWSQTYDLHVRLLPDVALQADGVRSTNDEFRDEIESILDRIVTRFVPSDRLLTMRASQIREDFDWGPILENLVGEPIATDPGPARYVRLRGSI
jgi:nicotinamide riboside kinase